MEKTKRLKVKYHRRDVGTMALWQGRLAAFEYSTETLTLCRFPSEKCRIKENIPSEKCIYSIDIPSEKCNTITKR